MTHSGKERFKEKDQWIYVDCYDHDPYVICRVTAETTEITMKECSAYGKIKSGESEETHIYEFPHAQWTLTFNNIATQKLFFTIEHS